MENNSSPNFAKLDMKETNKFHMLTNSPESGISDYPKTKFESNDTDNDSINIHTKCNLVTKSKPIENTINDQQFDDMKENNNGNYTIIYGNIDNRLDDMEKNTNNRFDDVNNRFDDVNNRFDDMKENINNRFDDMEKSTNNRLDDMEKSTNNRFDDVNNQFNDMKKINREFWITVVGGIIVSVITTLLK